MIDRFAAPRRVAPFLALALLPLGGCSLVKQIEERITHPAGMRTGSGCRDGICVGTLEEEGLETRLILIGDAGDNSRPDTPILQALAWWAWRRPERTAVVFLGDNVYPRGLRPGNAQDSLRLHHQLQVFSPRPGVTPPRGIFVPGNHDWYTSASGAIALAQIREEARRVESVGSHMRFLPRNGCPGPDTVTVGRVRLIAMDTHWWVRAALPPELQELETFCASGGDTTRAWRAAGAQFIERERLGPLPWFHFDLGVQLDLAKGAGLDAVLVSHHPLTVHGSHGSRWTVRERSGEASRAPMKRPFLHRFARRVHATEQDLADSLYRETIGALTGLLRVGPQPFIYAAGHDHLMEVIDGRDKIRYATGPDSIPTASYHLVSGSGSPGKYSRILVEEPVPLFWSAGPGRNGFIVVDFLDSAHGSEVHLRVVHASAAGRPVYYRRLR